MASLNEENLCAIILVGSGIYSLFNLSDVYQVGTIAFSLFTLHGLSTIYYNTSQSITSYQQKHVVDLITQSLACNLITYQYGIKNGIESQRLYCLLALPLLYICLRYSSKDNTDMDYKGLCYIGQLCSVGILATLGLQTQKFFTLFVSFLYNLYLFGMKYRLNFSETLVMASTCFFSTTWSSLGKTMVDNSDVLVRAFACVTTTCQLMLTNNFTNKDTAHPFALFICPTIYVATRLLSNDEYAYDDYRGICKLGQILAIGGLSYIGLDQNIELAVYIASLYLLWHFGTKYSNTCCKLLVMSLVCYFSGVLFSKSRGS